MRHRHTKLTQEDLNKVYFFWKKTQDIEKTAAEVGLYSGTVRKIVRASFKLEKLRTIQHSWHKNKAAIAHPVDRKRKNVHRNIWKVEEKDLVRVAQYIRDHPRTSRGSVSKAVKLSLPTIERMVMAGFNYNEYRSIVAKYSLKSTRSTKEPVPAPVSMKVRRPYKKKVVYTAGPPVTNEERIVDLSKRLKALETKRWYQFWK